jgi:hypothetical protein
MIIGVYWRARGEPREDAAERLSQFLESATAVVHEPALREWFLKDSTRVAARTRVPTDSATIAEVLSTNRRDVNGSVTPELGFRLSIWNGVDVSFEATIGSSNARVGNAAVVSFCRWSPRAQRRTMASAS